MPVLAHPGLYDDDELVLRLAKNGLAGIEVNHPDHDEEMRVRYTEIVRQFGLPPLPGPIFTGSVMVPCTMPTGTCTTDRETVDALKGAAGSQRT